MLHKPFCNTEVKFTEMNQLVNVLLSLDVYNIVLVISETAAIRWGMLPFISNLNKKCKDVGGSMVWIKNIPSNPTQVDVVSSLDLLDRNIKYEVIIAIGGGSCIDLAKALSAFHNQENSKTYSVDQITERLTKQEFNAGDFIDIIAIPSTAGSGSEVTQWATIWDKDRKCKYSIDNPSLKPKYAYILPELTLTLSPWLTLSTVLDSMCHAIEAYWSKHTSPLVQDISYRSVQLIIKNLPRVIEEPLDIVSRENLCRASVLAGLAFSQTRTTACHSISYPLTMLFHVPHGLAAAITLDAVSQINKGNFQNGKDLFDLFEEFNGIKSWIDSVCNNIVKMKLSTFGIKETDIPLIVENAFTSGRMDNNPVVFTKEDVCNILKEVL